MLGSLLSPTYLGHGQVTPTAGVWHVGRSHGKEGRPRLRCPYHGPRWEGDVVHVLASAGFLETGKSGESQIGARLG